MFVAFAPLNSKTMTTVLDFLVTKSMSSMQFAYATGLLMTEFALFVEKRSEVIIKIIFMFEFLNKFNLN